MQQTDGGAPAWLFSFVDLAFLMLIAMTQLAPDPGAKPIFTTSGAGHEIPNRCLPPYPQRSKSRPHGLHHGAGFTDHHRM